jgi:hypothetical protein
MPDKAADLSNFLHTNEFVVQVTPLYTGEIAFTTILGRIGVINADLSVTSVPMHQFPGQKISNGFAVDTGGEMYVVTNTSLHRIDWSGGELIPRWEHPVEAVGHFRPGKFGIGSGTTPTLINKDYVTIADDASSMNVLVVRTALNTEKREVCRIKPFDGLALSENSLTVWGRSIFVEQNYLGLSGVARIDLLADETCVRRWVSADTKTTAPLVADPTNTVFANERIGIGQWGVTALDMDTGKVRFTVPTGIGPGDNNMYALMTADSKGRIFAGTLTGLVRVSKGTPTTGFFCKIFGSAWPGC